MAVARGPLTRTAVHDKISIACSHSPTCGDSEQGIFRRHQRGHITDLSKVSDLHGDPRNSSFASRKQRSRADVPGRWVPYVLEGSVRSGQPIRSPRK